MSRSPVAISLPGFSVSMARAPSRSLSAEPGASVFAGLSGGTDAGRFRRAIEENEFGEDSFVFTGPDGASWQILEAPRVKSRPILKLEFENVAN